MKGESKQGDRTGKPQPPKPTNSKDGWQRAEQANGQGDTSDQQSASLLKKTGKAIRWAGYKGSAADVIVRDAKRMRPLYPEVWKQLFSKEGFKRLRERVYSDEIVRSPGFPWSAMFACITAVGILVSIVTAVHMGYIPTTMPWINKIGMVLMLILTTFAAVAYSGIFAVLVTRRRNTIAARFKHGLVLVARTLAHPLVTVANTWKANRTEKESSHER